MSDRLGSVVLCVTRSIGPFAFSQNFVNSLFSLFDLCNEQARSVCGGSSSYHHFLMSQKELKEPLLVKILRSNQGLKNKSGTKSD